MADFPPDEVKLVDVGGKSVGVVVSGERIYAFRTRCPHQQGPLEFGRVYPRLVSPEVGALELESPPVISCPWHYWEFDMETGRALCDATLRIAVYAACEENGRVLVDPSPHKVRG